MSWIFLIDLKFLDFKKNFNHWQSQRRRQRKGACIRSLVFRKVELKKSQLCRTGMIKRFVPQTFNVNVIAYKNNIQFDRNKFTS